MFWKGREEEKIWSDEVRKERADWSRDHGPLLPSDNRI